MYIVTYVNLIIQKIIINCDIIIKYRKLVTNGGIKWEINVVTTFLWIL